MTLILFLAAPIIALTFSLSEYLGWWDDLFGRKKALEGFDRLRFPHGYPKSFIFAEDQDKEIFNALIKRIAANTREVDLRQRLAQGETPSTIVTVGQAQTISGLPENWTQSPRFFYPGEQPVFVAFNWQSAQSGSTDQYPKGTGNLAGTLADLREWLDKEKTQRTFWINTIAGSCISIGCILLRLSFIAR